MGPGAFLLLLCVAVLVAAGVIWAACGDEDPFGPRDDGG